MLSGIGSYLDNFTSGLNQIENRMTATNQQITSGVRVNQPSDDPAAIEQILQTQSEIDRVTQVQSNLNIVNANAQTADSALQTASNLVDQLRSIAAEGATGTATATTRTELAQQVQQIGQQLVSIANTTVQGQYIFGGDASSTAPYTYQWSATGMAVSNSTAGSTQIVRDASGDQIVPSMTAQQIFDTANSDGTPGVFQTVFNLGQALSTNNQAGIQTAATALEDSVTQVGQAGSFYGNVENWIQRANTDASDRLVSLQQQLSSLRDTDVAGAATQLTLDQTAYQAAIQAQASLPTKTLFDYVG